MKNLKFVLCCHLLSDLVLERPHPKMLWKCIIIDNFTTENVDVNLIYCSDFFLRGGGIKLRASPIRQYWISQCVFSLWFSDSMSIWMAWLFCFRCLYQWSLSQRRNVHWAERASLLSLLANIRRELLPDWWAFYCGANCFSHLCSKRVKEMYLLLKCVMNTCTLC